MDELAGVVNLYPWYGAARKEMCRRTAGMVGKGGGTAEYAAAALYVGDRRKIYDMVRTGRGEDYSDRDVDRLLKSYIGPESSGEAGDARVRVVGGDYFSQAQYENVRRDEDNVFTRFAFKARSESPEKTAALDADDAFCTETLAQIYAEQGYYGQARNIYSRLRLNFPEKSAYFASLVQRMEELENY